VGFIGWLGGGGDGDSIECNSFLIKEPHHVLCLVAEFLMLLVFLS
jgi:hypothetical protein